MAFGALEIGGGYVVGKTLKALEVTTMALRRERDVLAVASMSEHNLLLGGTAVRGGVNVPNSFTNEGTSLSKLGPGGLPEGLNPMPKAKLDFWIDYLTKRGVKLEIGTDEAYRVLNARGAQGLFTSRIVDHETNTFARTIYLPENPNASVFYEEGLHALDSLKGRPHAMELNGRTIDAFEYRAKSILLDAPQSALHMKSVWNWNSSLNSSSRIVTESAHENDVGNI